jgi:VanZ family protein
MVQRSRSINRAWILALTFLFIAFFCLIVALADAGQSSRWWPFLARVPMGDKIGHFGLVGLLSLLCNLAFPARRLRWGRRVGPVTLTTAILFFLVSAEELSQAFIPSRQLNLLDWFADLAGLAAGQVVARKLAPPSR